MNIFERTDIAFDEEFAVVEEAWAELSARHFKMMQVRSRIAQLKAKINSDNDIIKRMNRGYLFELEDSFNILGTIRDLYRNITRTLRSMTLAMEMLAGKLPKEDLAMLIEPFINLLETLVKALTAGIKIKLPFVGDIMELLRVLSWSIETISPRRTT